MHLLSPLRTLLLCAVVALLGQPLAHGADTPGAYTFRSYGPEQGLRNQAVTGMVQDLEGFIFVATEDGLFRYDGSRFERFGSAEGLYADSLVSLYREPAGRIWAIGSKGAMAWAGSAPDPAVKEVILPKQKIFTMAATAAGYLVVAGAEGVYEGLPDSLVPIKGLPKMDGGAVWISGDGQEVLIAWHGNLYQRLGKGAWKTQPLIPKEHNAVCIVSILLFIRFPIS